MAQNGGKEEKDAGHGSVVAALFANGGIAVTKFVAAALSGSSAMLAEGFHSVIDTGNQAFMLLGIKRAKRPADDQHPFGYGQEIFFWSFVVAIVLFSLGAGFSVYEGIRAILHSETSHDSFPWTGTIVLIIAFIFEGYSWSVAYKAFNKKRRGEGLIRDFQSLKNPSIFVVLCEDTAALAGIVIALAGLILAWALAMPIFDAAASILIGIVLAATAVVLAIEVKALLIGEAAAPEVRSTAREILDSYSEVRQVNDIRSMHLGPEEILLNISVDLEDDTRARRIEDIVTEVERRLREAVPEVGHVFLEVQSREDHFANAPEPEKAIAGEAATG